LEAALGTDANIWLGLQAEYNMQKMKQDKSFMSRLEKNRKIAAIFFLRVVVKTIFFFILLL
jgi:plasmid maintenance system antidote protein VapI